MAEIYCPYCNGRNYLKISYAYRGIGLVILKALNLCTLFFKKTQK